MFKIKKQPYPRIILQSQGTINISLPVLIHEFLLCNSEGAKFVAKGVFILSKIINMLKLVVHFAFHGAKTE